MTIRKPFVAGQFYKGNKENLMEEIRQCFMDRRGPGKLPGENEEENARALISPHAGYMFSGPCASHGFLKLGKPDKVLIIGPSHRGYGSCFSLEDFQTPLGIAKTDKEEVQRLSEATKIAINDRAHHSEHSLEVQVPFLQYINKDISIIPLMLSHDINPIETAEFLDIDFPVVISSDMTHYGPSFGYVPSEEMKKIDREALDLIEQTDYRAFISFLERTRATICGQIPLVLGLKLFEGAKVKILSYYTSGDVTGESDNAVGYASVAFY